IRPSIQANILFVLLHDEDGTVGMGECFFGPKVVETYLHEAAAEVLFSFDSPSPESVSAALRPYVGFQSGGAEMRGNSAIDLALWDLMGKRLGVSLTQLFGGPLYERLPIYNTCAGPGYVSESARQVSDNWGLDRQADGLDDLNSFLTQPARLARDLWDEGIRGMKVWPFDRAAEASGGNRISRKEMRDAVAVIAAIRDELGDEMEIMVELHGLWNLPTAAAICKELTPYRPFWIEDPIRPDGVWQLAALKQETGVPIATGETLATRRAFLTLLERRAVDMITMDVQWLGGPTEGRKVASMADTFGIPVAPHDCTGPTALATAVALSFSSPNALIQETVRAFLRTWYTELVDGLPRIEGGNVFCPDAPGHGVSLREDLDNRMTVERRVTRRG
ncbi:MAG: mandelate racemase/muconate lactonizing enzyme family protein, partial [Propionibacteriaceae bacterium]|nr:mandelate racemase/muconate lactonizing enzyme family protein [Propionibacteriaceae bacterium]